MNIYPGECDWEDNNVKLDKNAKPQPDFLKDQEKWRNDPDKYEREATTPAPTPEPRRYAARYIGDTEAERVASLLNEAGTPETPNIDRCPKCGEYLHDEMGHMCPETPIAAENVKLRQRIEELEAELARYKEALEKLAKGNRAPGVLEIARAALRKGH